MSKTKLLKHECENSNDDIHWTHEHTLMALVGEVHESSISNTQEIFCFECVLNVLQDHEEIQIAKNKILSKANLLQGRPWRECACLLQILLNLLQCERPVTFNPNNSLTFVKYLYCEHSSLVEKIVGDMFIIEDEAIFAMVIAVTAKLFYLPEEPYLDEYYTGLSIRLIETSRPDIRETILTYLAWAFSNAPRCLPQVIRALNATMLTDDISKTAHYSGLTALLHLVRTNSLMLLEELTIELLLEGLFKSNFRYECDQHELSLEVLCCLAVESAAMPHFEPFFDEIFKLIFQFGVPSPRGIELLHTLLANSEFVSRIPIKDFVVYLAQTSIVSACESNSQCRETISIIISRYLNSLAPMSSDVTPVLNLVYELHLLDSVSLESIESLDLVLSMIPWCVEECCVVVKHLAYFFLSRQEFLVSKPNIVSRCCQIMSSALKVLYRQSLFALRVEFASKLLKSNMLSTLVRLEICHETYDYVVFHVRDLIFQLLSALDSCCSMEVHRDQWFATLLAPYSQFKQYTTSAMYGSNGVSQKSSLKRKFAFKSSLQVLMNNNTKIAIVTITIVDMVYWATLFKDYELLVELFEKKITHVLSAMICHAEEQCLDTKTRLRLAYIWAASYEPNEESTAMVNSMTVAMVEALKVRVMCAMSSVSNEVFVPVPVELQSWIWSHASDDYVQDDLEYFLSHLECENTKASQWIPSLLESSRAVELLIASISSAILVSVVRVEKVLSGFLLLARLSPTEVIRSLMAHAFPLLISTSSARNLFLHIEIVTLMFLYQNRSGSISKDECARYANCIGVWIDNYNCPDMLNSSHSSSIRLKLLNFLNLLFEYCSGQVVLDGRLCRLIVESLGSENSNENAAASLVFYNIVSANHAGLSSADQVVALIENQNPIVSLIGVHLTEFVSFEDNSDSCASTEENFVLVCAHLLKSMTFEDAIQSRVYMWRWLVLCSRASTQQLGAVLKLSRHRNIIGLMLGEFLAPSQLTLAQAMYLTTLMGICASLPRPSIPNEIYISLSSPKCLQKLTMVLSSTKDIDIFALLVVALQHAASCGMLPEPHTSDPFTKKMIKALCKLLKSVIAGQHPAVSQRCASSPPMMPVDMGGVLIFPHLLNVPHAKIHFEKIETRCFKLNQWLTSALAETR